MKKKQNNCVMMHGIWTSNGVKKIKGGDEVVWKICQYRYKKIYLKIFNFFNFLWINFEKAIMTSPLKIFLCVAVYPPRYDLTQNPKWCFSMQIKKVKFWNLSIFFVKIRDFSFYDIQYTFFSLGKRLLVFLLGPWSERCSTTQLENFKSEAQNSFFKSYSQDTKKSHIFLVTFFCIYFDIFYEPLIPTSDFFLHIISFVCLASWRSCFVAVTFSFRIEKFFQLSSKNNWIFFS